MTSVKYIGMDVHTESISIAVRNSIGKIVMECVIETKASHQPGKVSSGNERERCAVQHASDKPRFRRHPCAILGFRGRALQCCRTDIKRRK
jgi:hypothetical protein